MNNGGNGSRCASCEVPGRVSHVETVALRAESDAVAAQAAAHEEGAESRRRDDNLMAAIVNVQHTLNRLVEAVQRIEADLKVVA